MQLVKKMSNTLEKLKTKLYNIRVITCTTLILVYLPIDRGTSLFNANNG